MRISRLVPALALLALAAPIALAHIDHDLPHLQAREENRRLITSLNGTRAEIELQLQSDPLVNLVRHHDDAARGSWIGEFRRDDPAGASAFVAGVVWTRLVEYKDQNADLRFENASDSIVRQWRMEQLTWQVAGWRAAFIGGQQGMSMAWAANASGAPDMRFAEAAAGLAFTDEGAKVRQQDTVDYIDMKSFPPRQAGDLYALEGHFVVPPGATAREQDLTDANGTATPLAVLISNGDRLVYYDWGGQATLDGREQNLNLTLGPESSGDRSFVLDFPLFDKTLHMVVVNGIEYALPDLRSPGVGALGIVIALGGAAAALAARRTPT